jgi:hypothetical protein
VQWEAHFKWVRCTSSASMTVLEKAKIALENSVKDIKICDKQSPRSQCEHCVRQKNHRSDG